MTSNSDDGSPLPWFREQWSQLLSDAQQGRISHANLFSGRTGCGLEEFCDAVAAYLLCEAKTPRGACGRCRSCELGAAGNHPDLRRVTPAETGKQIGIDQIRELSEFYQLTAHYGQHKVAVIAPAELMNRAAANALLKTLEEPPDGAVLLLVSYRFDALPMTVRSRCRRLGFENIDQNLAAAWLGERLSEAAEVKAYLAAAMGAPLAAAALHDNGGMSRFGQVVEAWSAIKNRERSPFEIAKHVVDIPVSEQIGWLSQLCYEVLLHKFAESAFYGGAAESTLTGRAVNLKALSDRINLSDLYDFLDLLFEAKALLMSNASVRESDLIDQLWLRLDACYSPDSKQIARRS